MEINDRRPFGWFPGEMHEKEQKAFATRLAGELMGKGIKKGYTFRWIPNRLHAGLGPTSKERAREIAEEYPIVNRLENFRDKHVMMDPKEAAKLPGKPVTNDGNPKVTDGSSVIEELVGLGVLRIRPDGRIDVPDIYRYGFGIKRKGGVAKPK